MLQSTFFDHKKDEYDTRKEFEAFSELKMIVALFLRFGMGENKMLNYLRIANRFCLPKRPAYVLNNYNKADCNMTFIIKYSEFKRNGAKAENRRENI